MSTNLEKLGFSKMTALLPLDDDQVDDLVDEGQTGELSLDDVARMSVKHLRSAVRKERAEAALMRGGTPAQHRELGRRLAADLYGLARPPRVPRSSAEEHLPLALLSFMGESRRLDNTRLHRELRVQLRYPTVRQGLVAK